VADRFLGNAPPPLQDPVLGSNGMLAASWREYFSRLPATLDAIPSRINVVNLTTQGASLSATDFSGGGLLAGLYRATWYARITRPGSVSSSLTVALAWTDGGVACSTAGAALTGNTTATTQSGTATFRIDASTAVTYATTYASSGGTSMQHSLDLVLEKLKA
jgi:hypothetical protein